MNIKKTLKEWDAVHTGLKNVGNLKGVKFAYGVAKNADRIRSEFKILEEIMKPSDKYKEYDQKRIEICELHCLKDSSGKPVIRDNEYVFPDNIETVNKAIDVLALDYKEAIEERNEKLKHYQEVYETEVEVDIHMIKFEDVPSEITPAQYSAISCIIIEPK